MSDYSIPRRRLLIAGTALAAAAACGRPDTVAAPAGRRVPTAWGPVTVPDPVRSVVVLEGRRDADIALALGLPLRGYPVDTESPEIVSPLADRLAAARADGARELFARNEISLEAVAAAGPDLILGRDEDLAEIRAELTAIAAVLPLGSTASGVAWPEDLDLVARATGREEQAAALLTAYSGRIARLRESRAGALRTPVLSLSWQADTGAEVLPDRLMTTVLADVGVTMSPVLRSVVESGEESTFSPEEVVRLCEGADALMVVANSEAERRSLLDHPLWRTVPAVAAGRLTWADKYSNEGGPLTADHCLDLVDDLLATITT